MVNNAAPTEMDKALLDKVLESLGKLNFRGIVKENIAKRTPETGRWVIDSDWFKDWLMDLLGGIIWGTGMPGAGKTVLACIVIEHLQKLAEESESKDVCILFAFCRYTERLMVIDILFAILRQLLERHPQVLSFVMPMYERHKREGTRPSEGEIVDLLRQIATSGLFKKTFYILDGLDEAASDIQVDLLRILSSLRVHFFITSRPLDSLKDILPDAWFFTIIASDPDIALLIDQKVDRIPALRKLLIDNATLKADVVSIINSKSSGMFLLASLHLDMLKGCTNERQVRKALEGLPLGTEGMYDATMERIKALPEHEADLAKRVLIWVTYVQKPLTSEELVLAVSLCPETFQFDDKMEPTGIESILSLCCGLLQLEASTNAPIKLARFVHYSIAEYMVQKLQVHYPDDPHALIASTCIAFLRHYGFHDVSSQGSFDESEICKRLQSFSQTRTLMANYPYQYWGFHATNAKLMPASALEFLGNCKKYPIFGNDIQPPFMPRLPWNCTPYSLETLESIHVAALYGIREYFDRLKAEEWTSAAKLQDHNIFNSRGSQGSTPLILASMAGWEDIVGFLMGVEGVDVNLADRHRQTALFAAVAHRRAGLVKAMLLRGGFDVNIVSRVRSPGRDTPLTLASKTGQRDVVRLLLEVEGINVNGVGLGVTRAVVVATQQGHGDILKMLLKTNGIDVSRTLTKALIHGHNNIIEILLEFPGVSLDEKGSFNSLMRAARTGKSEVVATVLKHGTFDINARDDSGNSALAHSLHRDTFLFGAAELLLRIPEIDVNSADEDGTTILMLASRRRKYGSVVETILKLSSTLDINAKDKQGLTALAHAAERGSKDAVEVLLGVEGVDYNCVDAKDRTPLMMAANGGSVDVVALLLKLEGIKVKSRDNEGKTALAHAISSGHIKTCEALLKVDSIRANYRTLEGLNYLMLAAKSHNAELIRSVLQLAQFNINARDIYGRTALAYAVKSGTYDAVEALLEVEGVNVHCVDENGRTLLMDAASSYKGPKMLNKFLGLGLGANSVLQLSQFDINTRDIYGRTALAYAVKSGTYDAVEALLGVEGVNVHCVDEDGRTLLMDAASSYKGLKMINKFLGLGLGANINATATNWWTALFFAVYAKQPENVSALLKVEGIDLSVRDVKCRTVLMVSKERGSKACTKLLRKAGAS
ncbi:ankyrin [Coprinopsis marcescibilis]|uniref:Ankyrin n=1 Tax=Coprinopsis marcescibilis TaxID=230819 RepID=A0A5C3KDG8_COPMA|nr:ankyrin [Coprinopsis marcescibilis]